MDKLGVVALMAGKSIAEYERAVPELFNETVRLKNRVVALEASRETANLNMSAVKRYVERLESLFGGAETLARWATVSSDPGKVQSGLDWLARYEGVQSINMTDERKEPKP